MKSVEHIDLKAQALRDYMQSRVLSARPVEIVEMLYQVAIDNLNHAIRCLKSGEAMQRADAVTRAQEAVTELTMALDHSVGAPFTRTLAALYAYVLHQTIVGHASQSEEAFQKAIVILSTLLEGWKGVREQVLGAEAPALEPVEKVESEKSPLDVEPSTDRWADYQEAAPAGSRDWNC
jgi:flagellar protein FliS